VKYTGTIHCKECDAVLAEAKRVTEGEKEWHETHAFHNCRPHCEHAKKEMEAKHGFCFNIVVKWKEEKAA
jgi:hypothetical protein